MTVSSPIRQEPDTVSVPQALEQPLPEGPQLRRYFPGWTMVGVAAAAQYMSAPGQSYSVAAFKEPMRETLSISETDYSLAYAFATLVSGCLLPFIGRLVDRYGARRTLPAIAVFLGFACFGMSQVGSLLGLYFSFSFVRSLGQGALSLLAAWVVGEWFSRRRGFATALSGIGGTLSVMTIPLLNAYMISQFDWQTGWLVLGFLVWGVLLPPSLFLLRDRPEDIGLQPDGDRKKSARAERHASDGAGAQEDSAEHNEWTVSHVIRDATFWKLLAVPATSGMVGTGLVFHAVSLLGSRGVSPGWALALISFQALVATCATFVAGWLTDRCEARRLLAGAMLLLALASTTILWLPTPLLAIAYAVMLGLHGSVLRSTGMVVWMTYYGRRHQGAIRGIAMAAMIFAAAVGPLPLALSIDWSGSYNAALYLFITVPLVSCGLVWTARQPRHRPA